MPRIQNISKAGRVARGIGRFAKNEIKEVTDEQATTFVDGHNFGLVEEVAAKEASQTEEDITTAPETIEQDSPAPRPRRSKSLSNA